MVEDRYSPEVADQIIENANLESGGSYTTVGTYPHSELVALVTSLAEISGEESANLLRTFGRHLLFRFKEIYPEFFEGISSSFDLLDTIDNHVHIEVKKLYPDAELPRFNCDRTNDGTLIMSYSSRRALADLAHGLIEGAVEIWQENVAIHREDSRSEGCDGIVNMARFTLTMTD